MRERFQNFMYGRYGMDQLSRFLTFVALALVIVSMFVKIPIIYLAALAVLIWADFRAFSRNTSKRYVENEKFLSFVSRFTGPLRTGKVYREQRKIYRFFTCPQCRQKVRVPKGKGRICITCPKCRTEFIKKS